MRTTLLIADAAQTAEGKLSVLGAGWTEMGPVTVPHAVAAIVEIPWDEAGRTIEWVLSLLDEDGHPVCPVPGVPLRVAGSWVVGRPAEAVPGCPLTVNLALNLSALPLRPGRGYEWVLSVDGHVTGDGRRAFRVRPLPAGVDGSGQPG